MKTLLKTSAGIAALLTGAGLASAQDGTATQNQQMASDITCAQIVVLDQQEAERALYFLAGYRAAQQEMGTQTDTTAAADTGDAGAEMDTETTASAEAGTATETTTGTDTQTTAAAETGEAGMDAGTDTTTTAGTSAETGTAGEGSQMFAASGYFDIPVEGVITACREAPESRASDVLGQQSGSAQ